MPGTLYVYGCPVCGFAQTFISDQDQSDPNGDNVGSHVCPQSVDPSGTTSQLTLTGTIPIN